MSTRETYKLGIDTVTPKPTGAGGDLVIDNFERIADLIEGISGQGNGSSGYSGSSGQSGRSGTSGQSGISGYSGQGSSGQSGTSGSSGSSGSSGHSGKSGISGYSGVGFSGYSGTSGQSGASGQGQSGTSGRSGSSGQSGAKGCAQKYTVYSVDFGPIVTEFGAQIANGWYGQHAVDPVEVSIFYESGKWKINIASSQGDSTLESPATTLQCPPLEGYTLAGGDQSYLVSHITNSYSGQSGASGRSGYSGVGSSGVSGQSGISGQNGSNGTSGYSGQQGTSGTSGSSGVSGGLGQSGASGTSGYSGFSGQGQSGSSGFSGQGSSGISGYSGTVGTSGYSGVGTSGASGQSGISGYSGYFSCATEYNVTIVNTTIEVTLLNPAGNFTITTTDSETWSDGFLTLHKVGGYWQLDYDDGDGGVCSFSTTNANRCPDTNSAHYSTVGSGKFVVTFISSAGFSGKSGYSGRSGTSGYSGRSGISGYSGFSGKSGYSGISGQNGSNGIDGINGASGVSGVSGVSGSSGHSAPCHSHYEVTITGNSAAAVYYLSPNGSSTEWYGLTAVGQCYIVNYSSTEWRIVVLDPTDFAVATYYATKVAACPTLDDSFAVFAGSGSASITGVGNGYSGTSGKSGSSGAIGASGYSGRSGISGQSGTSGRSGYSGYSGIGTSGYSGVGTSGASGSSGQSGAVGTSGVSGISGYSGAVGSSGTSGSSGYSGFSGKSGTSGQAASCYSYYEVTIAGNAGAGVYRVYQSSPPSPIWYGIIAGGYQCYLEDGGSTWTITILDGGDFGVAEYSATKGGDCPLTYDSYSLDSGSGTASLSAVGPGASGVSGYSGRSGTSGTSGTSGRSGTSGYSGVGTSGTSGYSGTSPDPLLLATTTSSVGQIKINATRVLHSYGTNNFFVGTSCGNFTLTGQQNYIAANGGTASLSSGSYNTALGYQALNACSTGSDNLAIGRLSLAANGTSSVNLGIGNATLYQHTTGSYNVAVGGEACRNGTTRNSAVAIGYNAGYDTLGTGVTYIGRAAGYTDGSTATTASLTNATAIGYYSQITASNSLVLGGTGSYLVKGGIGTTEPNSRWHVNGSFATAYRAISALRTLDDTDHVIECTANTFTITLPAVSGITGRQYVVKNTGAGTITLDGNASETIDGATTQTVAAGAKTTIVCTGSAWISI